MLRTLTLTLLLGLALPAAAAEPLRVTLPAAFPVGLPTVLAAPFRHAGGPDVWRVQGAALATPILAQRDRETNLLWLPLTLAETAQHGSTLELSAAPANASPRVSIAPQQGGWQFREEGRPVLFFQQEPMSHQGGHTRAGFVHPVWGLDREILTEIFPSDHLHHHGVFWAWHQLWVGTRKAGDPWVTQDFLSRVRRVRVVQQGPVFATLRFVAHWTSPHVVDDRDRRRPIVEESTTIRLFRAQRDSQAIDFEIRLRGLLPDVRIGGAENSRGYSGFTLRVRPPQAMQLRNAGGLLSEDAVGAASAWADVTGTFRGAGAPSGIAILSHPSLPEFPPRWLLRHYGMQNVVYPGREPIPLSQDEPLVLRHRLLIHRGTAEDARLDDQQRAYEQTP